VQISSSDLSATGFIGAGGRHGNTRNLDTEDARDHRATGLVKRYVLISSLHLVCFRLTLIDSGGGTHGRSKKSLVGSA
jgi:hypothetical protein